MLKKRKKKRFYNLTVQVSNWFIKFCYIFQNIVIRMSLPLQKTDPKRWSFSSIVTVLTIKKCLGWGWRTRSASSIHLFLLLKILLLYYKIFINNTRNHVKQLYISSQPTKFLDLNCFSSTLVLLNQNLQVLVKAF